MQLARRRLACAVARCEAICRISFTHFTLKIQFTQSFTQFTSLKQIWPFYADVLRRLHLTRSIYAEYSAFYADFLRRLPQPVQGLSARLHSSEWGVRHVGRCQRSIVDSATVH